MDKNKIKKLASNLNYMLTKYSKDDIEVAQLLKSLEELLAQAELGMINLPIEKIPGRYWFNEGSLSKYADLESSYAKFRIAITRTDEELVEYENFKRKFLAKK